MRAAPPQVRGGRLLRDLVQAVLDHVDHQGGPADLRDRFSANQTDASASFGGLFRL